MNFALFADGWSRLRYEPTVYRLGLVVLAILLGVVGSHWSQTVAQDDPAVPVADPISVSGQVVDDETGKPVPQFIVQGGKADDKDPAKVQWGYSENRTTSANATARYSSSISWSGGWRARVVAAGYLPQPILEKAPKAMTMDNHTIRLKRGPGVVGVVRDHTGKPISGAAVFQVVGRAVSVTEGRAGSHHEKEEDFTVAKVVTDKDGVFRIPGGWCSEASLAVSCKELDLFVVSHETLPATKIDELANITDEEKKKLAAKTLIGTSLSLPQPGTLKIKYEIPGGEDPANLLLQLKTYEMPGWKSVGSERRLDVKNGQELVVSNLPPGQYEFSRAKDGSYLDRRIVTIKSGQTVQSDFLRPRGVPVAGVVLPPRGGKFADYSQVVYLVFPDKSTGVYREMREMLQVVDKGKVAADGTFRTGAIPPGTYTISVRAYLPLSPEQMRFTGIQAPSYVASGKLKVPDEGKPEEVRLQLRDSDAMDPPPDTAWGDMKDELRLGLFVSGGKERQFAVGEEVPVIMVVQNTTGRVLTFSYASYPYFEEHPLSVLNAKNENIGPGKRVGERDPLGTTRRIEPGQSLMIWRQNFLFVPDAKSPDLRTIVAGPGKYRLRQQGTLAIVESELSQLHKLEGDLPEQKTGTLEIEIAEPSRALRVRGAVLDGKSKRPIPEATLIVGSTNASGSQHVPPRQSPAGRLPGGRARVDRRAGRGKTARGKGGSRRGRLSGFSHRFGPAAAEAPAVSAYARRRVLTSGEVENRKMRAAYLRAEL